MVAFTAASIAAQPPGAEASLVWDQGIIQGERRVAADASQWERQASSFASQSLIRNQTQWEKAWAFAVGHARGKGVPPVNFNKEAVVEIYLGNRPTTGYRVDISSFTDPRDSSHLVIYYRDIEPTPAVSPREVVSCPYAFVKIKLPLVLEVLRGNGRYQIDRSTPAAQAAAQVSARDSQMQLALRLNKTKLKADDLIRYQIAVKNVGKKVLFFSGPAVFWDTTDPHGIAVEVQDKNGDPAIVRPLDLGGGTHIVDEGKSFMGMTPAEENRLKELQVQWNNEGLRREEIADRISGYLEKVQQAHRIKGLIAEGLTPSLWILPGGTATTPTWVYWPYLDRLTGVPKRAAAVGFAELADIPLDPGTYRVRANTDLSSDMAVRYEHRKRKPSERPLRTPFVDVEVTQ